MEDKIRIGILLPGPRMAEASIVALDDGSVVVRPDHAEDRAEIVTRMRGWAASENGESGDIITASFYNASALMQALIHSGKAVLPALCVERKPK